MFMNINYSELINIICLIGLIICVSIAIFHRFSIKLVRIIKLDNDNYLVTVKRLWMTYEYAVDKTMTVCDIDRNIMFKLIEHDNEYKEITKNDDTLQKRN